MSDFNLVMWATVYGFFQFLIRQATQFHDCDNLIKLSKLLVRSIDILATNWLLP